MYVIINGTAATTSTIVFQLYTPAFKVPVQLTSVYLHSNLLSMQQFNIGVVSYGALGHVPSLDFQLLNVSDNSVIGLSMWLPTQKE